MKNLFFLFFSLLLSTTTFAQAPNKFHYQGVARDPNGTVINSTLSVRFSFLEGGVDGPVRYVESHTTAPNPQGIFNLNIGEGSIVSGDIDQVNYATHQYWLKVELKSVNDLDYVPMGITQLLSVPYARYAEHSGDDVKEGTGIDITNHTISNTGDLSDQNEIQSLSVNGNQLSISNGNAVTLPTGTTYTEGSGIDINGNIISANDASATNEFQTMSINGNQLALTNGNTVTLPTGTTYTEGTGIDINGNVISANDPNSTNEIQTLSINGQQLSLSNGGGSVQLPSGTSPWTTNGTITSNTPISNNITIGSTNNFNSKLYVSASGNDHGGNFYSPGTGDAVHAYNNSTGTAVAGSSLNGKGGSFTSVSGTGGYFSSTSGAALTTGSGNVGIGTDSPDATLEVRGVVRFDPAGAINAHTIVAYGYDNHHALYALAFDGGTVARLVSTGGLGLAVEDAGSGGIGTGIEMTVGSTDWNMYIDAAKDMNFAANNTLKAWIYDTDGSYHNSSDRSLKKNIAPFNNVLSGLTKLNAYTYQMKDAADDSPVSVGFMAQEVEEQFPQLVTEKNGYKSLCYDHFAVLSVQAIKEQEVKIDALEKRIAEMEMMMKSMAEKSKESVGSKQ